MRSLKQLAAEMREYSECGGGETLREIRDLYTRWADALDAYADAQGEPVGFPKYGRFSLQELADAVDKARIGSTGHTKVDDGHDAVPFINFNSLNRIVTNFAAPPPAKLASVELLDDTSLRAVIGGIGNEVHNLSCEHQNSDALTRQLSDIAGRLWVLAQQCSAKPASVSREKLNEALHEHLPVGFPFTLYHIEEALRALGITVTGGQS